MLSSSYASIAGTAPTYLPLAGGTMTGNLTISVGLAGTSLTLNNVLTITPITITPSGMPTGSIIMSGSAGTVKPYYFNGTSWISLV